MPPVPKGEQAPANLSAPLYGAASSSSLGLPTATPFSPTPLNLSCLVDPATGDAGPGSRLLPPCPPQTELPSTPG